jgi:hypothetical protein
MVRLACAAGYIIDQTRPPMRINGVWVYHTTNYPDTKDWVGGDENFEDAASNREEYGIPRRAKEFLFEV